MKITKIIIVAIIMTVLGAGSALACDPVYPPIRYPPPVITNIKNGDLVGINAYSRDKNASTKKLYKGFIIKFEKAAHANSVYTIAVKDLKTGINLQPWTTNSNKATYEEIQEYGNYQITVGETCGGNAIGATAEPINITTGPANPIEIKSPVNYCLGGTTKISWSNCLAGSTYEISIFEKGKSKAIYSTSGITTKNVTNEITAELPLLSVTKTYQMKITEKLGTTYYNKTKSSYYFIGGTVNSLSFKASSKYIYKSTGKIRLYWDSHLPISETNKATINVYKDSNPGTILYTVNVTAKSYTTLDLKNILDTQYTGKYIIDFIFMNKKESISLTIK